MSYFNDDQQSYMSYLARLPREQKCECGWYLKGECYDCNRKEKERSKKAESDEKSKA